MARILIDSDLGIGTDYLDRSQALENTTLKKNVLRAQMRSGQSWRELRVLYVAMTTVAREQLRYDWQDRYLKNHWKKYCPGSCGGDMLRFLIPIRTAGSYLDCAVNEYGRSQG